MVQLIIAHPTSSTSSSLQSDLIYAFNGSLNPSIYFFIIHTTLWSFPLSNFHPIFTPPYHTLGLASNIYILLTSSPSSQIPFFFSITYQYHARHNTSNLHLFNIWYLNAVTRFETKPYLRQYLNSFFDIPTIGTHQPLGEMRFLKTFFSGFFFQDSMACRQAVAHRQILFYPLLALVFILTHKNQFVCSVATSFFCSLLTQEFQFQSGRIQPLPDTSPETLRPATTFSHPTYQ